MRLASLLLVVGTVAVVGCDWKPPRKPIVTGVRDGDTYLGEDHRPYEQEQQRDSQRQRDQQPPPPTDDPYVVARPLAPAASQPPSLPATEGNSFMLRYDSRTQPPTAMTEQELAAEALARIGPPAVPALVQALYHRDPFVRRQALSVLIRMGPDAKAASEDLTALLDDPDESIRKLAAKALANIGPEASVAVPALMRNLMQAPPEVPR